MILLFDIESGVGYIFENSVFPTKSIVSVIAAIVFDLIFIEDIK